MFQCPCTTEYYILRRIYMYLHMKPSVYKENKLLLYVCVILSQDTVNLNNGPQRQKKLMTREKYYNW